MSSVVDPTVGPGVAVTDTAPTDDGARIAAIVRLATPMAASTPQSSGWEEALTHVVAAMSATADGGTLHSSFRRAACAVLPNEECTDRLGITTSAYDGLVTAAVSRLVGVCDPIMRVQLARRAPSSNPEQWLDEPLLAHSRDDWLDLLEVWPVLAFVVGTALAQWRSSALELLSRLETDLPVITSVIFGGLPPGPLVDVTMGAGDRHNVGRSVTLLRFATGQGLIYKPRDLSPCAATLSVFELLNAAGGLPHLPTRRVLVREGYGYEERLEPVPTADEGGAARFYERLGALMCVMQLLGARDMWAGNLLAIGEEPHLVDLECVFCPPMDPPPLLNPMRQALYVRREATVLSTAIPVAPQPPTALCPTRDIGCLSHADDPVDAGGAGLAIGPFRPFGAFGLADPWCYASEIVDGYRATHDVLVAQRSRLLATDGPLAKVDEIPARFLWRDTLQYVAALHASLAPDALTTDGAREAVLDATTAEARADKETVATRFDVEWLSRAESDALRILDVPLFFTIAGDTTIRTSDGLVVAEQFERSGAEALRTRIEALRPDNVESETAFVRAAIDAARGGLAEPAGPARPVRLSTKSRRLQVDVAVREIAESLAEARRPPLGAGGGWLSVCSDPITGVCDVSAAGADLVGGALGPALFFGELDAIIGAPDVGALAVDIIDELLDAYAGGHRDPDGMLIGAPASSGLVGVCALEAVATRVAAATGTDEFDLRLAEVRESVLSWVVELVERNDAAGLATLHHYLLGWTDPPGGAVRLAAVLRLSTEVLVDAMRSGLPDATRFPELDRLVPVGGDAVAAALAGTLGDGSLPPCGRRPRRGHPPRMASTRVEPRQPSRCVHHRKERRRARPDRAAPSTLASSATRGLAAPPSR